MKVWSTTFVGLTYFDKSENRGKFSRYTDIDVDGQWFNTETFGAAEEKETKKIEVPKNLKPNLVEFTFKLFPEKHLLTFLTSVPGKPRLTPAFIEKYLVYVFSHETIVEKYGDIEVSIVKDIDNVKNIVDSKFLTRLKWTIKKPNTDDLSGKLRRAIERRLNENRASLLTEELIAERGASLTPSDGTKALAGIAATTGQVEAKENVDGVSLSRSTRNTVEEASDRFDTDMGEILPLSALSEELLDKITEVQNADIYTTENYLELEQQRQRLVERDDDT